MLDINDIICIENGVGKANFIYDYQNNMYNLTYYLYYIINNRRRSKNNYN